MAKDSITDRWNEPLPTPGPQPQCWRCKHFDADDKTCLAFPDGVPMVVLLGDVDHRLPFPGDNGVQFEPKEDSPPTT